MADPYQDYYDNINNVLDIYDGFLTSIEIAQEEVAEEIGTSLTIDNTGCERIYPKVIFENDTFSENQIIINSDMNVIITDSVSFSEMILDFENQEYTMDGDNIISKLHFPDGKPFYIEENEEQVVDLAKEGEIIYYTYPEENRQRFVEQFRVSASLVRNAYNPKIIDKEYNFDLEKLTSTDWNIVDLLNDDEKNIRIKYSNTELSEHEEKINYLLNVVIEDFDFDYLGNDRIMVTDLSGRAKKLI